MAKSDDPDLDILRSEAAFASTPTRRDWARRLVIRIEHYEGARDLLTSSTTWPTTTDRDNAADPDADSRDLEAQASDRRGDCYPATS